MAQFSTFSPKPTASPTATPNPYRALHFGTPTLGGEPSGGIAVSNGWVAVLRDGRGAHACISFKNEGSLTATRLLVEFPIMNHDGERVATLTLDRRGTFSPNVEIHGWSDLAAWQSCTHRGYDAALGTHGHLSHQTHRVCERNGLDAAFALGTVALAANDRAERNAERTQSERRIAKR
ncbi:MAG TPA: hypothetical protein VHR97_14935 [Candidatus Baltobacteraceae bacterium]|nr:hypothetical protein [Candidatus Baltobacteraceae bacterium]